MGVISLTLPSDGDTIDAADVNVPFTTIQTLVNGNLDSNNLADAAVTPRKLLAGTGSTWAWSAWTPTITGITVNNGTTTARYIQIGKTVYFSLNVVLGSTSTVASDFAFSLPVTAQTGTPAYKTVGNATFWDNSASALFYGAVALQSATIGETIAWLASGTYVANTLMSSTVPFTWAVSDFINAHGFYEAA